MSGKAGKSGRQKAPATLAKEALERNEMMIPTYLSILHTIAKNEDGSVKDKVVIDTAKYLIDRSQGRPKATIDLRFGETAGFTAEDYELCSRLFDKVTQEQCRLIEELGEEMPQTYTDRNELVKVQSFTADIGKGTVKVAFQMPSGLVMRELA